MVSFGSHLFFVYTHVLVYFISLFLFYKKSIIEYKFMKAYPILVPHFGHCKKKERKEMLFPT